MGASVVVHRILDELEAGEADGVVGKVVGAAGVADGQGGHAEIVERDHPGVEDGRNHFIALEIDAADFAGAIVDVVVGVELGVLGKNLDRGAVAGSVGIGVAEVLLHVGARAEETLFFAGPEADADGAAHLEAGGFEDADGFQHDCGASAVVGGACAGLPGIEVAAKHDDFVGLGLIGAGNFADDVERIQVVVVELVLDIDEHGDGDFFLDHANDAAVVFVGYCDAARSWRIFLFVAAAALLNEDGAIIAARRLDPSGDAFIDQEFLDFKLEFARGAQLGDAVFLACLGCGDGLRCEIGKLGVGVTVSLRLKALGTFRDSCCENELAFELALELGEVFFFGDRGEDRIGGDGTVGAGSPSLRVSDQRKRMRSDDLNIGALIGPAAAERVPTFRDGRWRVSTRSWCPWSIWRLP